MPIKRRDSKEPIRKRVYRCTACGTQQVCATNHTRDCWPICIGPCRGKLISDNYHHTYCTQTTHEFVRDYNGPIGVHELIK